MEYNTDENYPPDKREINQGKMKADQGNKALKDLFEDANKIEKDTKSENAKTEEHVKTKENAKTNNSLGDVSYEGSERTNTNKNQDDSENNSKSRRQ